MILIATKPTVFHRFLHMASCIGKSASVHKCIHVHRGFVRTHFRTAALVCYNIAASFEAFDAIFPFARMRRNGLEQFLYVHA